jgi:alpha-soluble NSF attachment protein
MDLLQQAQKEETRWTLFDTRSKYSKAAELYFQAGNIFTSENNHQDAAMAYVKSGDLYEINKEFFDSIQSYLKAVKQFKYFDPKSALIYLIKIKDCYELTGRLANAAKILEEIGDLDETQTMTSYSKAVQYYIEEKQIHNANKLRNKMCERYLKESQYELAANLYEIIANDYASTNSWSSADYYINALICLLALHDYVLVSNKLILYTETCPKLSSNYMYRSLNDMITACVNGNLQEFIDATAELDRKKPLEPWKVRALLSVRQNLTEIADGIL